MYYIEAVAARRFKFADPIAALPKTLTLPFLVHFHLLLHVNPSMDRRIDGEGGASVRTLTCRVRLVAFKRCGLEGFEGHVALHHPPAKLKIPPPHSQRVQVPNNDILAQNLYYNYYHPKPKYLIIGYLDP